MLKLENDKTQTEKNIKDTGNISYLPHGRDRSVQLVEKLLIYLNGFLKNIRMYPSEHSQVKSSLHNVYSMFKELLSRHETFTFLIVGDDLVFENTIISKGSDYVHSFIKSFRTKDIESVTFKNDVSKEELEEFGKFLAGEPYVTDDIPINFFSSQNIITGVINLRSSKEKEKQDNDIENTKPDTKVLVPGQMYHHQELNQLSYIFDNITHKHKFDINDIGSIIEDLATITRDDKETFATLAKLKSYDEYTFTHTLDVSMMSMAQAEFLGLDRKLVYEFGIAALLHDIGKTRIPAEVLNKPGKLDKEERALIEKHPIYSVEILLKSPGVPELAIITAFEHHLKYDFSGYPKLKRINKPNLCGMITTIADFYDALRTERPYREALVPSVVKAIMSPQAGKHFDPWLLKNFFRMMENNHIFESERDDDT